MKRRDFLKTSAVGAIAVGLSKNLAAAAAAKSTLVAVRGGEATAMFEKGILELGGMENFVKKGQSVVVKPNIGWAKVPEFAANTNPELVAAVVKSCLKAGAKEVYVFDHTCNYWRDTYRLSGIAAAAKAAGAKVVSGNLQSDYQKVEVKKGKRLRNGEFHKLACDCDVLINVPVLKDHGGAIMTCAMKNLMGIIWDRRYMHRNDLQQCIADCASFRKPDLNIVDAYRVMKSNGPRGLDASSVETVKYQLLSTDIVAVDVAAAKIINFDPDRIGYLKYGEELGLGCADLSKVNIKRIAI